MSEQNIYVDWNDSTDIPCVIQIDGQVIQVRRAGALRELWDCLDVLFASPRTVVEKNG